MGRSVKAVEQQRTFRRDSALSRLVLAGLALTVAGAVVGPGRAAVIGGARVVPFEQAVERSRVAAEAVVHRRGKETCLRGKLTNALLGLSSSCEKEARRDPLCSLADRAVVVTPMSLAFMDDTSRQLLRLIAPGSPVPLSQGRPEPEPSGSETP